MKSARIHKIKCAEDEYFLQEIPSPANIQSFFAFSLPKAGSTLLNSMLQDCCVEAAIPVISPYSTAFTNGIVTNSIGNNLDDILYPKGYAYLGFRHFLPYQSNFDFSAVPILLLVRDPRDMLTSLYFSVRYSHVLPEKKGSAYRKLKVERDRIASVGIDSFVLSVADKYVGIYAGYIEKLLQYKNVHVFRYEDVIFDKYNWLYTMLRLVDIGLLESEVIRIATKHDIRPEVENVGSHVRQVTPGNYKKHLSGVCVARLNTKFANALSVFGYSF